MRMKGSCRFLLNLFPFYLIFQVEPGHHFSLSVIKVIPETPAKRKPSVRPAALVSPFFFFKFWII